MGQQISGVPGRGGGGEALYIREIDSIYLSFHQERKFSPKRKFLPGCPCGHPAKNFGQALQILEKQSFWNGHPARTSMKKLRSEKLRADFPFPISVKEVLFLRQDWTFPL